MASIYYLALEAAAIAAYESDVRHSQGTLASPTRHPMVRRPWISLPPGERQNWRNAVKKTTNEGEAMGD